MTSYWIKSRDSQNVNFTLSTNRTIKVTTDWVKLELQDTEWKELSSIMHLIQFSQLEPTTKEAPKNYDPLRGVKSTEPLVKLYEGQEKGIKIVPFPVSSIIEESNCKSVSSDPKIASVSSPGTYINIKAHNRGIVIITSTVGGYSAITRVEVCRLPQFIQEDFSTTLGKPVTISLDDGSAWLLDSDCDTKLVQKGNEVTAIEKGYYEIRTTREGQKIICSLQVE